MGGYGSGRIAKRPVRLVEDQESLDIAALWREGRLGTDPGLPWVVLGYGRGAVERQCRIDLDWTGCHYGGSRPWWLCRCGRRRRVLYLGADGWRCRTCSSLRYQTQCLDRSQRALWRAERLRTRLAPGLGRPPRMHKRTHARLVHRFVAADVEHMRLTARQLGLLLPSL